MEAVAADAVVLVILIGNGVHVCLTGHGLMERGVEHCDHGNVAHNGLAGVDTGDVGGIVQGSEGDALFERGHDCVINADGACKLLAAVNHAVTDSVDLLHGGNNAVLRAGQLVNDSRDSLGMSGHGDVLIEDGLAACQRAVLEVTVNADALAQTLCHDLLVGHINELVLKRGAACVNNKNFHVSYPFSCK